MPADMEAAIGFVAPAVVPVNGNVTEEGEVHPIKLSEEAIVIAPFGP